MTARGSRDDLVFDVGMHNGDDTDFYLARGFRVLAIEADPTLAETARHRFRQAVTEGRLTILNVGIAEQDGQADFWICDANSEWNSFDQAAAMRNGSPHHRVSIPTRRFRSVLEEFGAPHYLKIDIEGQDRRCLEDLMTLPPKELPRFVSWENGEDGESQLELAHRIGYRRFKLIDQSTYEPVSHRFVFSNFVDSAAWRAIRQFRLARWPVFHGAFLRLTHRGRLERRFGRRFPMGSAGPWGDDLPGRWLSVSDALVMLAEASAAHAAKRGAALHSFWCDWHAAQ